MNRSLTSNRGIIMILTLVLALAFIMVTFHQTPVALAATCAVNHTVKSGDLLSSLAFEYGTTVEAIAEANNLKPPYTILIDQVLCIPASTGSTTDTSTGTEDTGTTGSTTSPSSTSGPYFTVTFTDNVVDIQVKNYPKNNTYYVNLLDGKMTSFYRLGLLSTRPSTTLQQTYQLPKELRGSKTLIFCLKSVSLDNIQCTTYNRQQDGYAPGFSWTIRYTAAK